MERPKTGNTARKTSSPSYERARTSASHGEVWRSSSAKTGSYRSSSGRAHYARSQSRRRSRRSRNPIVRFFRRNPVALPAAGAAVVVVILLIVLISTLQPAQDKRVAVASGTQIQTPAPTQSPTEAPTEVPTEAPTETPTEAPAPQMAQVDELGTLSPSEAPGVMTVTVPVEGDAGMPNEYTLVSAGIPNTDRLLGLQETGWVPDSYFNDAVFIGDSVSMKLNYYVAAARKTYPEMLGDAKFLTVTSFSIRNALKDVSSSSVHPTYQGKKMKVEDIVAKMGAKKVFIMLGMNDVAIYGFERTAEKMIELLSLIKQKSPDVQIFVQSATPRLSGKDPTTEELFMYNMKLYEYILQLKGQDIFFLDVAYVMRDENGKLPEEYCSDPDSMALHFNNTACQKWVEFLYTHGLPDQYYNASNT